MKRTPLLLLAAGCLIAALAGYRLGRDRAGQPPVGKADPRQTRAVEVRFETPSERSPEAFAAGKAGVTRSYDASPSAEHDWILRGHTAALLAGMTPAELARLLDEVLVRGDDGALQRTSAARRVLVTDLLRAWGRKDPRAACTAMVHSAIAAAGRQAAFRDWLLRDPAAVAQWMNSGDDVPEDLRKAWLSERLKADPQDALRQLAALTPAAREAALLEWSASLALRPAEREALLLAAADDPALQRKCAGLIAGALADRSVAEARAFVDGLELDEEDSTALHDGVFMRWAAREPRAAFADWAARGEDRVSAAHLRALDNWGLNSPGTEEAIRWLATVHPSPAKEQMQLQFIEDLARRDRFEQAVRMALSMDDREEGLRQAMRAAAAWKEKFPKGAHDRLQAISREAGVELP
jgi:hypothetical protein